MLRLFVDYASDLFLTYYSPAAVDLDFVISDCYEHGFEPNSWCVVFQKSFETLAQFTSFERFVRECEVDDTHLEPPHRGEKRKKIAISRDDDAFFFAGDAHDDSVVSIVWMALKN
jgi:hypothetical protein